MLLRRSYADRTLVLFCSIQRAAALANPAARFAHVAASYTPLRRDPALFDPADVTSWLHPNFKELISAINEERDTPLVVKQEVEDVYSFPLLTYEACDRLFAEVEAFHESGLPARRPNSMNNYGLILNEIGLRDSLTALQQQLAPLAKALFPLEGANLDDHHSFCVSYKADEDAGLDMHTDDSDVTVNVCLGREFTAAGLTFCGNVGAADHRQESHRYSHVSGRAVMHLGRRRHGADDITEGHRLNLVMWNYNRAFRASDMHLKRGFVREAAAPTPTCVSYTHDRDFEAIRGQPRPEPRFATTAWCPPPQAEYEGFAGGGGRYAQVDPFWSPLN